MFVAEFLVCSHVASMCNTFELASPLKKVAMAKVAYLLLLRRASLEFLNMTSDVTDSHCPDVKKYFIQSSSHMLVVNITIWNKTWNSSAAKAEHF